MARGKNSTALFEVIHTAKKPPKSSTSVSVPTPKWWAKSKPVPVKPAAEATDAAGKQGSWLAAAAKRGVLPTSVPSSHSSESTTDFEPHDTFDAVDQEMAADAGIAEISPVAEMPQETAPKPRFAERFAERFARKAASAASVVPAAVAPIVEMKITPAEPAFDPTAEIDLDDAPSEQVVKKAKRSRGDPDSSIALDRGAKEVQFRLSYGGIISLAFILVLIVALAALIGSHYAASLPTDTQADSKKPVDSFAGTVNLLALGSTPTANPTSAPVVTPPPVAARPSRPDVLAVPRHPAKINTNQPTPAAPHVSPAKQLVNAVREVGTTYLVVQSYDDKQMAQKACEYLNRNGVTCSVVQGLDSWAPRDWYCVVGLQPFTTNDPNLKEYQRTVTALGLKFSSKVLNQFEPKPYVWRAESGSHDAVDGAE